ncbi:ECF transporter S component [Paraliobacillus salinarum]|uniref:ECF transporter S component n=1 Tax=Paraliobacillus salinarum TaxID=1158996 RepID=UPI0015F63047|nr:ECF transporter S component [Paraliobacillus salinarum]
MSKTYRITLIAMLSGMAISGRYIFQFIPNVQPVTSLVILTGFFFGPINGMLLGIITIYISNLFMGMGIWTFWQIIAYILIGLLSGVIGLVWKRRQFPILVLLAIVSGFIYGLFFALTNYMISGVFWGYYVSGLLFDFYHAFGNVLFMVVSYKPFEYLANRYKTKYKV